MLAVVVVKAAYVVAAAAIWGKPRAARPDDERASFCVDVGAVARPDPGRVRPCSGPLVPFPDVGTAGPCARAALRRGIRAAMQSPSAC